MHVLSHAHIVKFSRYGTINVCFYNENHQVFSKKTEATHLEDSTCGIVYILSGLYANFKASFKPLLTFMKVGESDATQLFLAVTPIFVKTIVLLFPHEKKNCNCTQS